MTRFKGLVFPKLTAPVMVAMNHHSSGPCRL